LFFTFLMNSRTSPPSSDLFEHLEHRLVGAAVQRAVQRVDAGRDRREQVGLREPTSRTVEVEQFCSWSACRMNSMSSALHRPGRVVPRTARRAAEHHAQEVLDVAQVELSG
jgi:hypothetical protein